MAQKSHRHQLALGRVAPITGRLGGGGALVTVVGNNKVLPVPAKGGKALKSAGTHAMRTLRDKETT
jgi:hypothetical protein